MAGIGGYSGDECGQNSAEESGTGRAEGFDETLCAKMVVPATMTVITQIGFLEGAPILNVHGFCVYNKNRLILPFWSVVKNANQSRSSSGVAGVLEANHIRPTHDKQDFEKSILYQKLETRLRDMTIEYWNCHCYLISYQTGLSATPEQFFTDSEGSSRKGSKGIAGKRRRDEHVASVSTSKKQATGQAAAELENNHQNQHECSSGPRKSGESDAIMQQNRKLRAECLDDENTEKKLILKAERLRKELQEYEQLHCNLMIQLKSMDDVKVKLEVGRSIIHGRHQS